MGATGGVGVNNFERSEKLRGFKGPQAPDRVCRDEVPTHMRNVQNHTIWAYKIIQNNLFVNPHAYIPLPLGNV